MIKPEQIRAARALLRLEQQDLARRARVSVATVRRLALEAAGAEFIPDGVRRRRSRTPEEKAALLREIMAIADRVAALSTENPGFSEEDLYDEYGLPA